MPRKQVKLPRPKLPQARRVGPEGVRADMVSREVIKEINTRTKAGKKKRIPKKKQAYQWTRNGNTVSPGQGPDS